MPYRSLMCFTLILLLAGCAAPAVPAATATPTPANTATLPQAVATMEVQPTATETLAPTETSGPGVLQPPGALDGPTQTYANQSAGFLMEFPADWKIADISQQINATRMYTVSAISPFPTQGPKQQEGLPPGASKMDVNVNPTEQPMSYADAVVYWRNSIAGGEFPAKILDEKTGFLPSGLPATRWVIEPSRGGGPILWTLVEVNGNIVNFIGMGDLTLVDKIIGTVRSGQ